MKAAGPSSCRRVDTSPEPCASRAASRSFWTRAQPWCSAPTRRILIRTRNCLSGRRTTTRPPIFITRCCAARTSSMSEWAVRAPSRAIARNAAAPNRSRSRTAATSPSATSPSRTRPITTSAFWVATTWTFRASQSLTAIATGLTRIVAASCASPTATSSPGTTRSCPKPALRWGAVIQPST